MISFEYIFAVEFYHTWLLLSIVCTGVRGDTQLTVQIEKRLSDALASSNRFFAWFISLRYPISSSITVSLAYAFFFL